MNAMELRQFVSNYENTRYIYMNFSVDEEGIWGLPEGIKSLHFLEQEKIKEYKDFLNKAIQYCDNMLNFFNNDYDLTKKRDKYNLYLKRLKNALNKLEKQKENNITTSDLTMQDIFNSWTYDESMDQYWIDTKEYGTIMHLPDENIFIIHEGTNKEYTTDLKEVNELLKTATKIA